MMKGKTTVDTVGIIYNVKSGHKDGPEDEEAEYDNLDTVHAIKEVLESMNLQVHLLEADEELVSNLKQNPIDIAFNIAEGKRGRGREAEVPAILNLLGIPFSGSDETTLCIALDKAITKRLITSAHIRTPKYAVLQQGKTLNLSGLTYPIIIKPNAEGSSKGISDVSIVESKAELNELVKKNHMLYHQDMLAEEYIEGREFTVGVLGNGKDRHIFPPMEIKYKKSTQGNYHVYSYPVKQDYKNYVAYECPAKLTPAQEQEMIKTTAKICDLLGCLDFARVDYRMDYEGKIYFIEINPLPGLAPGYSDYPMLADFSGMDHKTLVQNVFLSAVKRHGMTLVGRSC